MNLLFDLDGTLVDSSEAIFSSLKFAFSKLGLEEPTRCQLESAIGPPMHLSFAGFLNTQDEQLIWQGVNAYREHFAKVGITDNVVYDGITDTLETLRVAGARLFVATAKPIIFASQILQLHGLSGFFQTAYGSELDGTYSDKGELISYLLASESLAPNTCVMIGDRKHDMIGAIKNNVRPMGVLWGFGSRDELMDAGAEQIFDQPGGLTVLLD